MTRKGLRFVCGLLVRTLNWSYKSTKHTFIKKQTKKLREIENAFKYCSNLFICHL